MTTTKVLVTGVFDVLHIEHQNFLKAAKAQGDKLYVGLEPDARVKKLKGSGRPINNLKTRIKNIKNLKLADRVFALPSNLDTKQGREVFIKTLKPDILAVSASTPNLTEKRRIIKLIGGQVKVVHPHNPKVSSSKIIQSK